MATQAVTNITRTAVGSKGTALNIGGQPVEVFRIASGAAPADTAVITPSSFTQITTVFGPVGHSLSGTGASTVTVTLPAMGATNATIPAVDIWIFGPVN